MSYLLYCIMRTPTDNGIDCPLGVGRQPVSLVTGDGLSAAISPMAGGDPLAAIPEIIAFGRVVEAFHRRCTVIPMRYGCLAESAAEVGCLLEDHREHYQALLEKLNGCAEMGIRLIVGHRDSAPAPVAAHSSPAPKPARWISPFKYLPSTAPAANPGRMYLIAQMTRYAAENRVKLEVDRSVGRLCAHLAGVYVCKGIESQALAGNHMVSLSFLVRRECIEAFHSAFRQARLQEGAKLLLSGPWPPYNFASPEPSRKPWTAPAGNRGADL